MDTLPCRLVLSLLTTSQCTGYTPFRLDCSQWCSSPVLQRQSCDAVSQELAASLTPTLVKPGDGAGGHCIAQDPPAATFWTSASQPETPNDTRKPRASRGPARWPLRISRAGRRLAAYGAVRTWRKVVYVHHLDRLRLVSPCPPTLHAL